MDGLLVAVEIGDKRFNSAVVAHRYRLRRDAAAVRKHDGEARVQEREFAQAVFQLRGVEGDAAERPRRWPEGDLRARPAARIAGDGQRRDGFAVGETHVVLLAVAPDCEIEPFRQRVDD